MSLIMTVYNIKRSLNILGMPKLLEKLLNRYPDYDKATSLGAKRPILRLFEPLKVFNRKQVA